MNRDFLNLINESLLNKYHPAQSRLDEAINYSLSAGGKRIRPLLVLTTLDSLGGNVHDGLPFGIALEMIHTYSLIHDDLPAMDNDDYRRGKLTNHKQFDEATAILAGDALLTDAFQCISNAQLNAEIKLALINLLSTASGSNGMVYGQMLDMQGEHKTLTLNELERIHIHKTGELIRAAIVSAGIIMNYNDAQIEQLNIIGKNVGLMFQIKDDILDVEGSFEEIGKTVGSDLNNDKSTYVSLIGLEASKQLLYDKLTETYDALETLQPINDDLKTLITYIVERNK
ncbi:polyprenyl synthetase family protein [Macrococcus armenti]|uniref:polyprenyl synthetase family protein n=1 Tax=Macrococcus armenti TaxID=2875764 RepID=UPI001CD01E0D|nr:farnesyl diphosphate synthase [Macrococcus armenti]UBH12267.1 polyprenyl synthetase family protein [Macrococcus armenti]